MDLKEYKIGIGNLSVNEKKLRDLHLRKLAFGELYGPMTGYASIDKPWLKYYEEEALTKEFGPMSLYQLMKNRNIGYDKEVAIDYFGKKITYGELLKNIDIVAKSLLELGVKKGDIIMMCMPNTPESEYLFYAINKIGAVINCVDPRSSVESMIEDLEYSNIKYFFGIDAVYGKTKNISSDIKMINISPFNSMPFVIKQLAKAKSGKIDTDSRTILWEDFIKNGKNSKIKNVDEIFEPNKVAAIVHTGGTTGASKGVMLTNEQMNGLIYQMIYGYPEFKRGQKFMNFMPPFIALGLNNSTHLSACFGLYSYMIPSFEPEDMPNLLLKYKPNIFLCGPTHLALIMRSNKLKNVDLSFLDVICSGGEKLPLKIQEEFQQFLKSHNSVANIWIGYGATETSAGIACMKNNCFKFESVGIPYLQNNIVLWDNEKNKEVYGYDNEGEIRIQAPTIMEGYYGNSSSETDKVIIVDETGNKSYCTGDIGHISSDGLIYIDGRMKQIIMRKVFKIVPQPIEQIILSHPAVNSCSVVGVEDDEEFRIPVANIVLKEEFLNNKEIEEQVIKYVDEKIKKSLPEYWMLAGYNFIEALPRTPIGKVDFKKLEQKGIINGKKRSLTKNNYINN